MLWNLPVNPCVTKNREFKIIWYFKNWVFYCFWLELSVKKRQKNKTKPRKLRKASNIDGGENGTKRTYKTWYLNVYAKSHFKKRNEVSQHNSLVKDSNSTDNRKYRSKIHLRSKNKSVGFMAIRVKKFSKMTVNTPGPSLCFLTNVSLYPSP